MATQVQRFRSIRTAGFWLAAAIAALHGVNAVRTVFDPQGSAIYMGLPVDQLGALIWAQVYRLGAGFIAVLTAVLLARSDLAALRWIALAALLMSLGDAWLTASSVADATIVGRHLAIALVLPIAWHFLSRAAWAGASA